MPDAAPQPTSSRSRYGCHFASCPHLEASVAANCVMPPSRPIDPPEPMVISDDKNLITALRNGSRPSPATTTSSRLLEPCGPTSRNPQYSTNPAHKPPSVGVNTRGHFSIINSATSIGSPGLRKKKVFTDSVA